MPSKMNATLPPLVSDSVADDGSFSVRDKVHARTPTWGKCNDILCRMGRRTCRVEFERNSPCAIILISSASTAFFIPRLPSSRRIIYAPYVSFLTLRRRSRLVGVLACAMGRREDCRLDEACRTPRNHGQECIRHRPWHKNIRLKTQPFKTQLRSIRL